jgi:apolipoprotein N-acyltransferase
MTDAASTSADGVTHSNRSDGDPSEQAKARTIRRTDRSALSDLGLALLSALLLILAFPNFDLWALTWIGFVPLLLMIGRGVSPQRAFLCGWLMGASFFYGTCHWLTYSMVHYGGIRSAVAYLLLLPGVLLAGLFPAIFALVLARLRGRWGMKALFVAPAIWVAIEWARLAVTGQLWNAVGYSQAYHPTLIATARWGGVYAVGFLIVLVSVSIVWLLLRRNAQSAIVALIAIACAAALIFVAAVTASPSPDNSSESTTVVIAIQPNVPMNSEKTVEELQALTDRHVMISEQALAGWKNMTGPRLVIWPESPMNFSYATDYQFRDLVTRFAQDHHTSVLFNSQEPAPNDGFYNSAIMINEAGRLVGQYDKIRLMPFGEYVPLPQWMPGANRVTAMVGGFTPGTRYTLLPLGDKRVGVFICIESAYPSIARTLAAEGADVLINISNDGYLGPTAVMRQHLANAIFRAVENDRPVLRVTNTGITAYITRYGEVQDATPGFQPEVRTWAITRNERGQTFFTKHGDLFAGACAVLSLLALAFSFRKEFWRSNA